MPGDHPLRPYYDRDSFNSGYLVIFKPGVGLIDTSTQKPIVASLGHNISSQSGNFFPGKVGLLAVGKPSGDILMKSADKNYVYDLELLEYFDLNNLSELSKNLVWNFFKNYCKVLLSQPLEIVRLVLQVGYFDFASLTKTDGNYSRLMDDINVPTKSLDTGFASDYEEEIDYFQLPSDAETSLYQHNINASHSVVKPTRARNPNKIYPISRHTIDIMTAITSKDGPFALFKGINASFIHYTLSHTIEAWITGFLSPFLSIPDPFFLDLTHSTEPAKSLWLSVLACVLAGVILMPLDLIKVKFMLTQFNKPVVPEPEPPVEHPASSYSDAIQWAAASSPVPSSTAASVYTITQDTPIINPRSVRDSIRNYPRTLLLRPPPTITLLTVLHQFSTTVFRKLAPYLLFVRYNIDSYLSPNLYTVVNLLLLITELFIKLPVENMLRKEQVRFLLAPKSHAEDPYRVVTIDDAEENLIVTFNGWDPSHLFNDEDQEKLSLWTRFRILGLFNGWRVGVLNVIGFWGYNIFKSSSVMAEERL